MKFNVFYLIRREGKIYTYKDLRNPVKHFNLANFLFDICTKLPEGEVVGIHVLPKEMDCTDWKEGIVFSEGERIDATD